MAPEQQFCLKWNNYQTNLSQVFEQLLQSERFVDVTLACEGNSLRAHRMVLSACSTYFQTVLADSPCSHPVIILQEVKWSELKAIIEFMYKGEINISQEQLASLLKVAESLKIRGLADVGTEDGEAVLTSPTDSPRVSSSFWADETPRKRRRISDGDQTSSRTPSPRTNSPAAAEVMHSSVDIQNALSRASSNPSTSISLASASPVASLASSLSSLAHLQGPMPPPGPPLPPHMTHLPPLSPLSPLLNMHPMPRHHPQEDFEIRPGIAEMIREEERRRRDAPDMAKLLESTHHWIGNPMADSYQAQVQAAWQKSWNQTQSLLQNLRFRERGPLKSWRPETMAEAIHAVLKEGLSLSQAARKYDIPYPTFVLYANRVHNLLGPSHEPGDMRPKGRGRPQRILLGSWPEDQIKGVIRAVVFRDTALLRDHNDSKENKHPTTAAAAAIKAEAQANKDAASTASTSHPQSASAATPQVALPAQPKQEPTQDDSERANASPSASNTSTTPISNTSPSGGAAGPPTPQSRPSSASSTGYPNGHISNTQSPSSTPKTNGGVPLSSTSPPSSYHAGQHGAKAQQRSPTGQYPQSASRQQNVPSSQQSTGRGQNAAHMPAAQQLLGMMSAGAHGVPMPGSAPHMPRMYNDGAAAMSARAPPGQAPMNSFHPGFPRPAHPAMLQTMGMLNTMNPGAMPPHMPTEEQDMSPEALLFGKLGGADRHSFNNTMSDTSGRQNMNAQFEAAPETSPNPLMYRDAMDTIKNEPEAILNQ